MSRTRLRPARIAAPPPIRLKAEDRLSPRRSRPINVAVAVGPRLLAEALEAALRADPDLRPIGDRDELAPATLARRPRADVAVLDHATFAAGGGALLGALAGAGPPPKALVLVASDDEVTVLGCARAGAVGCVAEDRPLADLIEAIKRAHAGEVLFPPDVLLRALRPADPPRSAGEPPRPGAALTARERAVLRMLASGAAAAEAADRLGISRHTLRSHLKNAMAKLGARSKLQAIMIGLREGVLEPPR